MADGPVRWLYVFLDLVPEEVGPGLPFWRAVTGAELSAWRGDRGQFATLVPLEGDAWLKVQKVGGPGPGGGVHLDLHVDDPDAVVAHAVELGAREVARLDDVVVLHSPGGFPFCVCAAAPEARRQVRTGQSTLVDQLCLDIPADRYAGECEFWSRLTSWDLVDGSRPEFRVLGRPGGLRPEGMPVRFLLQRLGEATGPVRGHLDLACSDLGSAVADHERIGAAVVGPGSGWVVMRAPGGRTYCLTRRDPVTGVARG